MAESSIEWTEMTWNPTTGCDKVSAGCKYCYAEVMAKRLTAMGVDKYKNGFELTLHPDTLKTPYTWKKAKRVFVNSMSDLFHKDVPLSYVQDVFNVMNDCDIHTFQVLTKRGDVLSKYNPFLNWSNNIWMGVSVEDKRVLDRIDYLRETDARIKFLSVEPLIGPLPRLDLSGIHWVIVGGESGFKARPMQEAWVQEILEQCKEQNVAFFFKQWGGKNKKKAGRLLNGRTYDEYPDVKNILAKQLVYA
jgi:protein gp37